MTITGTSPCPCGSAANYADCCQPLHRGAAAPSPEALMRSRYTAFVLHNVAYLKATWHASTRPAGELDLTRSPEWTCLQVLAHSEDGERGEVHFRAIHKEGNGWGYLEEVSQFVCEAGRWFYVTGDTHQGGLKPGRNEPCPCGSGRKYKACCL